MRGYVSEIEKLSLENNSFRKVLYTDANSQLVMLSTNFSALSKGREK